jgi:hypothetical protein
LLYSIVNIRQLKKLLKYSQKSEVLKLFFKKPLISAEEMKTKLSTF